MRQAAASPAPLAARTRRLDRPVDLLEVAGEHGIVWERGGVGLAARGTALSIHAAGGIAEVPERLRIALACIAVDDRVGRPGTGPVAFGALPFDPEAAAALVVPETVVGVAEDGSAWVTTVGPDGDPGSGGRLLADTVPSGPEPTRFEVSSRRPVEGWMRAVASIRDQIRDGRAGKVVLAREVEVTSDAPLSRSAVAARLRAAYPGCYLYAVGPFVGASPELLVSRFGNQVRSHPMAGTAPRSSDPSTDSRLAARLLASAKDREEHQVTIDAVIDSLLPFCSYVDSEAEPSIVAMANVQHLATLVHGRLSDPPATALDLAAALHPTPAVCGSPARTALQLIRELEGMDRGSYAGPVGWVDHRGDGAWAVAIRCAEIEGRSARAFAGVGVVADSEPAAELAETRAKLQAVLSAVVRP